MSPHFKERHKRSMKTLSRARPRSAWMDEADRDAALFQRRQKVGRGELEALIGVPDLGLAEAEGRAEGRQTEAGLHRIGEFPTEHEAAEPIHDGNQVEEAPMHRNVSNIGAPDLVGPFDRDAAQQVWVDLVARRRATRST